MIPIIQHYTSITIKVYKQYNSNTWFNCKVDMPDGAQKPVIHLMCHRNFNHLQSKLPSWMQHISFVIESIKTTSMEDISTRVLEKIKNI